MTSLIKNVNPDYITAPEDLLETKASILADGRPFLDVFNQAAHELFQSTQAGAYLPWDTEPLFTAYEELYTHRDTYEYFPEIAEPVMRSMGDVMEARRRGISVNLQVKATLGDRINWRDAINTPINVYNKEGRLLLKKTQHRDEMDLRFNPGPEIFSLRFMMDIVEHTVLSNVRWGEPQRVEDNIRKYINPEASLVAVVNYGQKILHEFLKPIVEWIKLDPWLIYKVTSIGTNIVVSSSCDYRHFKCNEDLIERLREQDPDHDLLQTFRGGEYKFGKFQFHQLEGLYKKLFEATGHRVTEIPELFELLDKTKTQPHMTITILGVLESYLKENKYQDNRAVDFVSQLTSPNFIQKVAQNNGSPSLNLNGGTGIYIL